MADRRWPAGFLRLSAATCAAIGGLQAAARLSSLLVVKDRRHRCAAKLIRDGRGQVQEVTFSFSGGCWWVSVRMRVPPAAVPQPAKAPAVRVHDVLGLDAGMGRLSPPSTPRCPA